MLLLSLFATVMTLVTVAGLVVMRRRPTSPGPSPELSALQAAPIAVDTPSLLTQTLQQLGERVPTKPEAAQTLRSRLQYAGYRSPEAAVLFRGVQAGAGLLLGSMCGLLGWIVQGDLRMSLLGLLCGAGLGYLLPRRVLETQIQGRSRRLRRALPPALDLMVLSIEAGQSLDATVLEASRQIRATFPDLAAELFLIHWETRTGTSRSQALRNLGTRNVEPELKRLSNTLMDSDRFGVSLGPILRNHAKHLRVRMRQRAQEQAKKISVKMVFPLVLLIFPTMLLVTLGPAVIQLVGTLRKLSDGV